MVLKQTLDLQNGYKFEVNTNTKQYTLITPDGHNIPFDIDYKYYSSYYQENDQASGAYIFRPMNNNSQTYG